MRLSCVLASWRSVVQDVEYAKISVVDAERRLFANALLDPRNSRFILLSETCIPIFNFSFVYHYLTGTPKSFVRGSNYKGPYGTGRWHRGFLPLIQKPEWRKGSQWVVLDRKLARNVVGDVTFHNAFVTKCLWTPYRCCCPDEHYIQTMLYKAFPHMLENRTLTWMSWGQDSWSPRTFGRWEVSSNLMSTLRGNPNCIWNEQSDSYCHLFARKFEGDSLRPLMRLAHHLGY